MATYTTLPDSALDADSPITESLMLALRDNPLAIQEGDATAPKIANTAFTDNTISGVKLLDATTLFAKMDFSSIEITPVAFNDPATLVFGAGLHYYVYTGTGAYREIFHSGSWIVGDQTKAGFIFGDGANTRIRAGLGSTGTLYILKIA